MKLFFLLIPFFLYSQSVNETTIRILQDRRVIQSEDLLAHLRSENPRERELALLAVANIQDTTAFDHAASLLNDDSPAVRSMAAFALGMLGKAKGTGLLFRRLSVEREEKCIAAIFNAIGMTGTADDLKKVVNQSEHYRTSWKPYTAQSLYRFANRKIKDPSATKYAIMLLDDPSSIINSSYAIMRFNDTLVVKNNADRIRRLLNNSSPLIRMWGSTILGMLDDDGSVKRLITAARKDKDWRVRVNALRALRTKQRASKELVAAFTDVSEHAARTAVESYGSLTADQTLFADSAVIIPYLSSAKIHSSVKDDLRRFVAKRLGSRAIPLIGDWKSTNPFISAQRIRAYGETRSMSAIPVVKAAMKESESSVVTIAGLEAYQSIASSAGDDVKKDFLKSAALLFSKKDAGISYSAAVAFQDTSISKSIRTIFRSALSAAYMEMKSPNDLEPMVELLNLFSEIGDSSSLPAIGRGLMEKDQVIRTAAERAFRSITGTDAAASGMSDRREQKPFYSMTDLRLLDQYTGADVLTSKGKIRIQFEKEAAPFTVLNFILLARTQFYDGLPFHRVVSNFVIQGGDPLGNGSGGPNYSIRSEVHPNAVYRTGAVGMASSGKDTEGSQWFITHCPTPHLDFRYTIFGYTRDNKIVDQMMVGDKIIKITLVK